MRCCVHKSRRYDAHTREVSMCVCRKHQLLTHAHARRRVVRRQRQRGERCEIVRGVACAGDNNAQRSRQNARARPKPFRVLELFRGCFRVGCPKERNAAAASADGHQADKAREI